MRDQQIILGGILGIAVLALILLVGKGLPAAPALPPGTETPTSTALNLTSCEEKLKDRSFVAKDVYQGIPATVRFDSADPIQKDPANGTTARAYRTVIQGAAAGGVNFAGEYAVATWGLGTGIQGNAVVNVRTGKIISYGLRSFEGVRHAATSSLLILNPIPRPEDYPPDVAPYRDYVSKFKRQYYTVEDDRLVLLCEENAAEGIR